MFQHFSVVRDRLPGAVAREDVHDANVECLARRTPRECIHVRLSLYIASCCHETPAVPSRRTC